MRRNIFGFSITFITLIYLWIKAVIMLYMVSEFLMRAYVFGTFVYLAILMFFIVLTITTFSAIFGINFKKPALLIPHIVSQIMGIIFTSIILIAVPISCTFAFDWLNQALQKYLDSLIIEFIGTASISYLKLTVVIPMIYTYVMQWLCFILSRNCYRLLVEKNTQMKAFSSAVRPPPLFMIQPQPVYYGIPPMSFQMVV